MLMQILFQCETKLGRLLLQVGFGQGHGCDKLWVADSQTYALSSRAASESSTQESGRYTKSRRIPQGELVCLTVYRRGAVEVVRRAGEVRSEEYGSRGSEPRGCRVLSWLNVGGVRPAMR